MLLDGRGRPRVRPDVGRDVKRRHGGEAEASRLAPRQKLPHGPPVRRPRPRVRDLRREELQVSSERTLWRELIADPAPGRPH